MAEKSRRFSEDVLAVVRKSKSLRIRASNHDHRFIGIWMVVVDDRVFVRSWSLKPGGWYRTFLKDPHGAVQVGNNEIPVRAVRTRSESLKDAVDQAYLAKYNSRGEIRYARDLVAAKCRAATIELIPAITKARAIVKR